MTLALDIEDLSLVRGGRMLFRALNFSLHAGEALSVEGPNGAGKTSLLRSIAGFLRPASGRVRLRAQDVDADTPEERGKFAGWLGAEDGVKPQMSVREQLDFFARLYGSKGDPGAAMERFGLKSLADLPGRYLSAGQRRRLALARLDLCTRPLWLLDEPLMALDSAGKVLVAEAIEDHLHNGGIVLFAGHEALSVKCETLTLGGK